MCRYRCWPQRSVTVAALNDLTRPFSRNAAEGVSFHVAPDWRLMGFAFAVSLLTGMIFGLAPALRCTRPDVIETLKSDTLGSTGPSRHALRNSLVVLQVALSMLLLIGAALFARSLSNLRDIDLGFRRDRTVIVTVDPRDSSGKSLRGS